MNPRRGLLVYALLALLLGALCTQVSFTNEIGRLVPEDGPLPEAMALLKTFSVADTLLIEVDGTGHSRAELLQATDLLGEALAEDPEFSQVRYRIDLDEGISLQQAVAPIASVLIPVDKLVERTRPEGLQDVLQGWLTQLSGPAASLVERQFRQDPLDLTRLALDQVRGAPGPFEVQVAEGHFLDPAGERAVLFVQPTTSSLEADPDQTLLRQLEGHLSQIELPARYLGGHRIAADSARMIRDDLQRAAGLGLVALVLLFWVGFRSLRPVAGALGPVLLAVGGGGAVAALVGPIHGINLGFVAPLLGLGVDYWIHLYVEAAARVEGESFGERLEAGLKARQSLARAFVLGAGSTLFAFAVLSLSRYPVVSDLGRMGLAAVGGALLGTWLAGPWLYAVLGSRPFRHLVPANLGRGAALVALGLTALALMLAPGGHFDGDPRALNGLAPDTAVLEEEFAERYGGFGTGGMVVTEGETLGEALDQAARVQGIADSLAGVTLAGPTAILPGPARVQARLAALPSESRLAEDLAAAAEAVGFSPEAVAGATLPRDGGVTLETWTGTPLEELVRRHVRQAEDGVSVMQALVFSDDQQAAAVEQAVSAGVPQARLLIPSQLAAAGVTEIRSELLRLGGLSLAGILVLLISLYREPRKVIGALVPCLAAIAWTAAAMALLDRPWNAVSTCSMVLILGLGLDYGVFMVEAAEHGRRRATSHAVLMSALTTIVGFGILVSADSPALNGVGLATLVGVAAASLVALTLVPRWVAQEPILGPRLALWGRRGIWALLVLVHLDLWIAIRFWLLPPEIDEPTPTWTVEHDGSERRFGPNRLVRQEGVWTVFLEGSPYEMGFAFGALTEDLNHTLEEETLGQFRQHVPTWVGRYLIIKISMLFGGGLDTVMKPEHLEEIWGVAQAVDDPYKWLGDQYSRKVYYHALHDLGQAFVDTPLVVACSGLMAGPGSTADGHWLLARNFDFDGGAVFDRDKVVVFRKPTQGIPSVSVAFAGMAGVVSGMNAEGLALAANAGASEAPIRMGMPMSLILRQVLDEASSLDEAEAILKASKGFVSELILVVDGDAGEGALFELTPDEVHRLPVDGDMGVTNHFRHPALADDAKNQERLSTITTVPRLARLEELLEENRGRLDMETVTTILRDRSALGGRPLPPGHRHALNADIATHSVLMDATSRTLWVSRYPNAAGGYVAFSMDEALEGSLNPVEVIPAGDVQRTLDVHRARNLVRQAKGASTEQAEDLLEQALKKMPGHPWPLLELSKVRAAQGRLEDAEALIEQARVIPPEYQEHLEEALVVLEAAR